MSTTKRSARPSTTSAKKKEPKAKASARRPVAAAAPARRPKPDKAEKPAEVEAPKKRAAKAKVVAPLLPAPPRPEWNLSGPIPPEGASFPPKVGALLGVGQKTLGIKNFRPGQAEAFDHLLAGEDLLAVMPTGSGKSLLYQLTSMVVPGVTVVVSPLIALIKDQLDKMVSKGVAACKIDSTLTVKQRREVDALVRSPGGKLLLTTPERMADPAFRVFLREACGGIGVSRFVVDEAHCVSQWGHDFRPSYLSLRKAVEEVGNPPILATTATAPPHVRDDILMALGIEKATIVTTTFDRPNLHYEVIIFSDETEKMRTLVTLLKKLPRPGIVYCATVKKVEELYEQLTRWGIPTARYHGRMNKGERDASQETFMASPDLIMVATNAFGLGVDKSNIRNVLHYHVPGSLETYAQEAGRGGRDGKPARCVLLFSPDDVAIQEYFLSGTYPTKRQVRMVYEALDSFGHAPAHLAAESPPTVANIALSSSVGQQRTRTVLSLLKDEKYVTETDGLFMIAEPPPSMPELMERARQYEARRIADRQRLDSLLAYVKAPGCRSQVILEYLGEENPPPCGRCDNCLRSREAALAASTEATRLGYALTRQLDDDQVERIEKPRREIKARVVRIDQPAAPAPTPAEVAAALAPPKAAATVLRRSHGAPVAAPPPPAAPAPIATNGVHAEPAAKAPVPSAPGDGELDEDDEDDDDDLDDDELDDELDEGADDDLDDDDEDDDDDDADDDDDDDDSDDYEVIDKTAAELAEEGVDGPGEITVLARKRVPKVPKQRPQQLTGDPQSASAAEARRRRRRRRRKRRAMLPPKSAFTTPVLSTGTTPDVQQRRSGGGGGGPVIEYVRGPMRIAMAPVASANPNDAGVGPRGRRGNNRKTGGRRWDRGAGNGGGGFRDDRPRSFEARPAQPVVEGPPGEGGPRKRRRRRRRRGPGDGPPLPPQQGAPNGEPRPVQFFEPVDGGNRGDGNGGNGQQPPLLGPDGQPLRKRRRRRRRGRGGQKREWRAQGGPGEGGEGGGAPPGEGGGDGGDAGGGDDGGAFSDGE